MDLKIVSGSLFVHCKNCIFLLGDRREVTRRITSKFSDNEKDTFIYNMWNLRYTPLNFAILQGSCSPEWFICTLLTDRNEHVAAKADSSLSNRRASLSRSLPTYVSVDSRIVLKPFDLAQVCHGNKICSKIALTWKLTLELAFPSHCISN